MNDHRPVDRQLLVDEDLLEDRPALPADLAWQRAAVEPGVDRRPPDRHPPLARNAAPGQLELDLARLEDLADERPRACLQLALGRAQVIRGIGHRVARAVRSGHRAQSAASSGPAGARPRRAPGSRECKAIGLRPVRGCS
jgi:hypothetical protein